MLDHWCLCRAFPICRSITSRTLYSGLTGEGSSSKPLGLWGFGRPSSACPPRRSPFCCSASPGRTPSSHPTCPTARSGPCRPCPSPHRSPEERRDRERVNGGVKHHGSCRPKRRAPGSRALKSDWSLVIVQTLWSWFLVRLLATCAAHVTPLNPTCLAVIYDNKTMCSTQRYVCLEMNSQIHSSLTGQLYTTDELLVEVKDVLRTSTQVHRHKTKLLINPCWSACACLCHTANRLVRQPRLVDSWCLAKSRSPWGRRCCCCCCTQCKTLYCQIFELVFFFFYRLHLLLLSWKNIQYKTG